MMVKGPAGDLYIDDGGQAGVPVVFVPSAGGDTTHWSAVLEHLRSKGRRCVALDLRGHGRSQSAPDHDFRIESLAADIAAVVDHLGIERFILVGHSMGGSAALAYAGLHPDRLAGLVVVESGGDPHALPAEVRRQIIESMESDAFPVVAENYWAQLLDRARPEVREKVLAGMRQLPRPAVISQVRALFDFDPRPALGRYAGPVLSVVAPENDAPHSLHALVHAVRHAVVTGTSHWIHLDKPEEVIRILDGFLGQIP